ncbi:MAG: TadE/TadG family type IV pilus assembly protein, partial [Pseudolabrys sp.]
DSDHTFNPIIILLSDGLNTKDRWYGDGSNQSSDVDNRMADSSGNGTCKNIKNALVDGSPVTIYTVQVNTHTPPDPTSTLLQNCASSTDKFFQVSSASQIGEVFQKIGTDITKLHLSE